MHALSGVPTPLQVPPQAGGEQNTKASSPALWASSVGGCRLLNHRGYRPPAVAERDHGPPDCLAVGSLRKFISGCLASEARQGRRPPSCGQGGGRAWACGQPAGLSSMSIPDPRLSTGSTSMLVVLQVAEGMAL